MLVPSQLPHPLFFESRIDGALGAVLLGMEDLVEGELVFGDASLVPIETGDLQAELDVVTLEVALDGLSSTLNKKNGSEGRPLALPFLENL